MIHLVISEPPGGMIVNKFELDGTFEEMDDTFAFRGRVERLNDVHSKRVGDRGGGGGRWEES